MPKQRGHSWRPCSLAWGRGIRVPGGAGREANPQPGAGWGRLPASRGWRMKLASPSCLPHGAWPSGKEPACQMPEAASSRNGWKGECGVQRGSPLWPRPRAAQGLRQPSPSPSPRDAAPAALGAPGSPALSHPHGGADSPLQMFSHCKRSIRNLPLQRDIYYLNLIRQLNFSPCLLLAIKPGDFYDPESSVRLSGTYYTRYNWISLHRWLAAMSCNAILQHIWWNKCKELVTAS